MSANLIIILLATAVAATLLSFAFIRGVLAARESFTSGGTAGFTSLRQILAPFGAFVARQRTSDAELEKKLARYDKMIAQSGGKFLEGATAAEIYAARFVLPVIAVALIALVGSALQIGTGAVLLTALVFGFMVFLWPEQALGDAARLRVLAFSRDLPQVLDIMRLVSQSGGDLYGAVRSAVEVAPDGPVRDELARVLGEVTIGTSLAEALNNVAARIDSPDANAVFSTLAQSLEMGTSVVDNLGAAAALIRKAARTRAQEKAQKAVVAMTFPLLLLILPGVFIVLFAPLIIQSVMR